MRKNINKIYDILADYKSSEDFTMEYSVIEEWITQFPENSRINILDELAFSLNYSYINKNKVYSFLKGLLRNKKLVGDDPETFWSNANILNIQTQGSSQKEYISIFSDLLKSELSIDIINCGSKDGPYIYIDDIICSGNRIKFDILNLIKNKYNENIQLEIIVMALHQSGFWYSEAQILEAAKEKENNIKINFWRIISVEDRKYYNNNSDVLRPTFIPEELLKNQFILDLKSSGYPPVLRVELQPAYDTNQFSSEKGRQFLEIEFLKAGLNVLRICSHLPKTIKPLGYSRLNMLGFGSLIITYRNCPNTVPPAIWAGDPWKPLLPRKVN